MNLPAPLARTLLVALFACLLGACSAIVPKPVVMAQYDLGPFAPRGLEEAFASVRIEVTAAPWLASSAMQYRLDASDPAQRRVYAHSRWVSSPPAMLRQALARSLGSVEGQGGCRLRIELDEFIQRFDDAGMSRAEVLVRASLLPARGDRILAVRAFALAAPAPSADAAGGVLAHREAVGGLAQRLEEWMQTLASDMTGGTGCGGLVQRSD